MPWEFLLSRSGPRLNLPLQQTTLTQKTNNPATHLSFAFGVGTLFNFRFDYRPREPSPVRYDQRSAITDYDMAKVRRSFQHDLRSVY